MGFVFVLDGGELVEKYLSNLSMTKFFEIPRAVVSEVDLNIGEIKLQYSVLNDGRRVIKDTSLFTALDRKRKDDQREQKQQGSIIDIY